MPTYPGSQSTPYGAGVETTVSSLACLNLVDTKGGTLGTYLDCRDVCTPAHLFFLDTKAGEILRRGLTSSASDSSKPTTPLVSYEDARAHQHLTPPHSVPSMGRGPYYQPSYFPTQPSQNLPRTKSHPGLGGGSSSYTPSSSFPIITSPTPNHSSALLRGRANSHQQSNVTMTIDSTPHQYILMAPLGPGFSSDSITIAARKENVIVIFADRWDQEQDCE